MDKNLKNQQELYDQGWRKELEAGKEECSNLKINLEFLAETGLLKQSDKILEIGCGIGSVVFELSKQGYDITGMDISHEAIAYGLKKYGDIKLQVQAAETLPFGGEAFDIVLSFDLFEHIAQVDRHVSEVFRILQAGGHYLFQTPNKYSNVIFGTLATKSLRWRKYHPSLHSPTQLKQRLLKHGFEVRFVKMNTMNEFTLNKFKKICGPISHIFKHINFRQLPLSLQTNLYVVAAKSGR